MAAKYEALAHRLLGERLVSVSGSESNCLCPFHNEKTPSLRFNIETGLWKCWGCGEAGTANSLSRKLGRGSVSEPETDVEFVRSKLRKLRSKRGGTIGGSLSTTTNYIQETSLRRFSNYSDTWWLDRGFELETISTFDLGFDVVRNDAIIPIRDLDGGLVAVCRRNASWAGKEDGPKYRYPKRFPRQERLFAEWLVAEDADDWVALVEGPVDCMKVWQAGFPALAIYGSSISQHQIRLLHRLGIKHVMLFFDNDEAGERCADGRVSNGKWYPGAEKLLRSGFVVNRVDWSGYPRKADPGGLSSEEIGNLLCA